MAALAIELGNTGRAGYGSIHKVGCRDLSDGELLGEAASQSKIRELAYELTGWDQFLDYTCPLDLAPCVKL